jgi:hypothetical protein
LNTESGEEGSNISWKHFIRIYSTKVPPHALEATGNSESAIKLRRKYFMTSPKLFTTVNRPSHPTQRPVTAMGSRSAVNGTYVRSDRYSVYCVFRIRPVFLPFYSYSPPSLNSFSSPSLSPSPTLPPPSPLLSLPAPPP